MMIFLAVSLMLSIVAAQECANEKMTSAARGAILKQHNTKRSQLAMGKTPTHGGGFAPSGKNIYQLEWDCKLELTAQDWADRCVFEHSTSSFRHGAGENIYMMQSFGPLPDIEQLGNKASEAWWQELMQYGISNPKYVMTMGVFNSGVGHFTQMAWGPTTRIGCGIANKCQAQGYGTKAIIVCQYLVAGNMMGAPIYELGNPCKNDTDCTLVENSTCLADDGLCRAPNGAVVAQLPLGFMGRLYGFSSPTGQGSHIVSGTTISPFYSGNFAGPVWGYPNYGYGGGYQSFPGFGSQKPGQTVIRSMPSANGQWGQNVEQTFYPSGGQ